MTEFGIFLGVVIIYLSIAIRWVPKPQYWVIEYNFPGMGTRNSIWKPGLHILWIPIPPLMYVRGKEPYSQQPFDVQMGSNEGLGDPDPVEFKDDSAGVNLQIILQIDDGRSDKDKQTWKEERYEEYLEKNVLRATYALIPEADLIRFQSSTLPDPPETKLKSYQRAALNRVQSYLRAYFGGIGIDDAVKNSEKRKEIETEVCLAIDEKVKQWGVRVVSVAITNFILREETLTARRRLLDAEKTSEVTMKVAEGQAAALVTIATAQKKAATLGGEGEMGRIKALKKVGFEAGHAAAYVVAQGSIQELGKANTTIIATSEGGNMSFPATVAGMFKGMFGGNQSSPTPPAPPTDSSPTPPRPTPSAPSVPPDLRNAQRTATLAPYNKGTNPDPRRNKKRRQS